MIPQPRSYVLELPVYVPGERELEGILQPIKLSSNESTLGASPQALKAFTDTAAQLHRYPDPDQNGLRDASLSTSAWKLTNSFAATAQQN